MAVFPIENTSQAKTRLFGPGAASSASAAGALSGLKPKELDRDAFLRLLVTELKNQSPLDPVENENFIAQLAQFSALENSETMNQSLSAILGLERLGQGAALVGRRVVYFDPKTGESRPAIVSAVEIRDGAVFVDVGGTKIPLENVLRVDGPSLAGFAAP
jgi:flagellar basal-body rod modification protein FlgD